jgi:putative nucleotidyltransferase-like protein
MTAPNALSVLLPSREQAHFLRACLHGTPAADKAFTEWLGLARGDPAGLGARARGDRSLLPLLHRSVSGDNVPAQVISALRASRAHEELRAARYREALHEILAAMREARVAPLVLPGAGIVERVYGDWALRHSHDLDLLVRPADWDRARAATANSCRGLVERSWRGTPDRIAAVHRVDLPVQIHARLGRNRYCGWSAEAAFVEGAEEVIDGTAARTLTPEMAFAYTLAQAGAASPRSLRWAADAWHLAVLDGFDWEATRDQIRRGRASLVAGVLLRWLSSELALPCPPCVIQAVEADAEALGRPALDAALSDAVGFGPASPVMVLRAEARWTDRGRLAGAMLFPSYAYLCATERRPAALGYARRTLRYLRSRARN